jgi:hypothetical protein
MKATQLLHNLGQGKWLDNITRDLLDNGTLETWVAYRETRCTQHDLFRLLRFTQ